MRTVSVSAHTIVTMINRRAARSILARIIGTCIIAHFALNLLAVQFAGARTPTNTGYYLTDEQRKLIQDLRARDKCGTILTSKTHGFDLTEYRVTTKDNYVLTLHRIIHPTDFARGPRAAAKKPYLLLHGLVGTSASYVTNVHPIYGAPSMTYNVSQDIDDILRHKANEYEFAWQSTADSYDTASDLDQNDPLLKGKRKFAKVNDIDFDGDPLPFGRVYKQAYRKFSLPKSAKPFVTNSLAFTLSNFGYDVWLINLRGNYYSRTYNGRYKAESPEYWDFNIDTLVREDLLASINFVARTTQYDGAMGFVSYSYSSLHVLGLLTKYPMYQDKLQPVVMLAPSLLSGNRNWMHMKYLVKLTTQALMAKNGPFPAIGRVKEDRIESLICHLPIASKLCRFLENILHGGKPKSVINLVVNDRRQSLVQHDTDCGQTSKAVLHQLVQNLSHEDIDPRFVPFVAARNKATQGRPTRRSVMLIRSESDEVATVEEVDKIRDFSLRLLALTDVVIKHKNFGHTDFLFSDTNQYLVNAEVARMVGLFDYLATSPRPKLALPHITRWNN